MSTWQHFLVLLIPRVWPLEKSLGASKTETQTLVERSNLFSIKYSKSDKRTLIIYFNELLSSPLERSLGFDLLVRPAKCEEALRNDRRCVRDTAAPGLYCAVWSVSVC